jgi:hypothetical protein
VLCRGPLDCVPQPTERDIGGNTLDHSSHCARNNRTETTSR